MGIVFLEIIDKFKFVYDFFIDYSYKNDCEEFFNIMDVIIECFGKNMIFLGVCYEKKEFW